MAFHFSLCSAAEFLSLVPNKFSSRNVPINYSKKAIIFALVKLGNRKVKTDQHLKIWPRGPPAVLQSSNPTEASLTSSITQSKKSGKGLEQLCGWNKTLTLEEKFLWWILPHPTKEWGKITRWKLTPWVTAAANVLLKGFQGLWDTITQLYWPKRLPWSMDFKTLAF